MTYRQKYMTANSYEELKRMAVLDAEWAMMVNRDRLYVIEKALNEVAHERGWLEEDQTQVTP